MSNSLWPHGLQHTRLPCPSPSPRVCSDSCPLSQWCYLTVSYKILKVKVAQSCPTLCDPMDCILHGILQARKLEWVAVPCSRGSSRLRNWTEVSCIAGGFFTSWAATQIHIRAIVSSFFSSPVSFPQASSGSIGLNQGVNSFPLKM